MKKNITIYISTSVLITFLLILFMIILFSKHENIYVINDIKDNLIVVERLDNNLERNGKTVIINLSSNYNIEYEGKSIDLNTFKMLISKGVKIKITSSNLYFAPKKIEIFNDNTTLAAFLNSDITNEEIEKLIEEIENLENVKEVEFKSKEQLKEEMISSSDTLKNVLSEMEENPLLDSIIITVNDYKNIENVKKQIKNHDKIKSIEP